MAPELIDELPHNDYVVADKGYDSEAIRVAIEEKPSIAVIPRRKNSKVGNKSMDWCLYKYRHLVENIFARLKHFRSIATRYDKLMPSSTDSRCREGFSGNGSVLS